MQGDNKDNSEYSHLYLALTLMVLTGINSLPSFGYMSEFSSFCENCQPFGVIVFLAFECLMLVTVIMTIVKGAAAVRRRTAYGLTSLIICILCILWNLIPWIVNASVVFGFDFK